MNPENMVRPIKDADKGFLSRPLNLIFGAPSHIAILRALRLPMGMTGRDVARAAGLSQQGAAAALASLVRTGVVKCLHVGRANLYTLNTELKIMQEGILPLLEKEFAGALGE